MLKVPLVLSLLFAALFGTPDRNVTLSGVTSDCFADSLIHVPRVTVFALDKSTNTEMLDSLRAIDRLNFSVDAERAMARMENQFNRVLQLAQDSTALGQTTSDANGAFAFSLPPQDSVIVFGYFDSEDEPFSYAYKVVGGQANSSVVLDMSRGGCNYIAE
jgi:hypothetical protein